MIPTPAMKMCENELIAHCGLNVLEQKRVSSKVREVWEAQKSLFI